MDPCKISRLCPRTPTEVQIQGNLCRILFFGLGLPGGIAKQHKRAFFPLRCFSYPPFFLHRILGISSSNQQFLLVVSVERGGKSGQVSLPNQREEAIYLKDLLARAPCFATLYFILGYLSISPMCDPRCVKIEIIE